MIRSRYGAPQSIQTVDVPLEMDLSYRDAQIRGAFLLPMEIHVEVFNSPLDVPVEMDFSYRDAQSRGALLIPMEIVVEVCTSPVDEACRPISKEEEKTIIDEAFRPLSKEEEQTIKSHFSLDKSYEQFDIYSEIFFYLGCNGNSLIVSLRRTILVAHRNSNIIITGDILSCLKPREWLNDEVINLYVTLLKEREIREPEKHVKCHFFNTFFFAKLVNSGTGYNYEAVRKWTSMNKLGYHLKDCEKIFVPISMNLHWSLVVINIKDQKLQYLDSLKGYHSSSFIDVVAKYYEDEVKDKNEVDIDLSRWTKEFVQDLPVQNNVYDCGMFMLKYMDFYSRGQDLCFTQEQIPYFRLRTAKELLQLKAE